MVKFKFSFGKINIIIEMITASVLFKHHLAFEIPIHYKSSIAEGKIMSPKAKCIPVAVFFFTACQEEEDEVRYVSVHNATNNSSLLH